ncbi:tyrosine-type recombinase/integrase [Haloferula sp. A504]|uniref:tyrosine-type recombinase/integrase n=1 Tax=Haloferula sp. A504 TaxID=3373601 RepID=UPI0031C4DC94|nr:hypothetical protein [Verrucomicrobiaceae bacterium E54]
MSQKTGKPYKIIKDGSVSVRIYRNFMAGKFRFQVAWNEGGRTIAKTRTKEADAIDLAEKVAARLADHGSAKKQVVSGRSYQALRRLQDLADGDVHALLSELEAAKKHLGQANWIEAARFWKMHAPENFKERMVSEVFEEYMELIADKPQKARSGIRSKVKKFTDRFGGELIGLVTTKDFEKWFRQLPGTKNYANKVRAELVTFFRKAQVWGYLPEGEVVPAKIAPHRLEKKEPAIFSVEKAQEVLGKVRDDCVPYVAIGLFAGLRPFELACPGETRSLRWEDIDFEKGYIKVRAEVDGKNRIARWVKMSANLMEWLLPYRKLEGKVAMTRAAVIVSKDLRDKGVIKDWPCDVMRHSFCSYLLAKEQNIGLVAEQAGNSPEMIRKHYRRPLTQEEGEAWFEIRPDHGEAEGAEVA